MSMLLSLLPFPTDTTCAGKINTANICVFYTTWKMAALLGRVHGSDTIRHDHSNHKDGFRFPYVGGPHALTSAFAVLQNKSCLGVNRPHSLPYDFFSASVSLPVFVSSVVFHRRDLPLCLIDYLLQYLFRLYRCVLGETVCNLVPCVDPPQVCFAFRSS